MTLERAVRGWSKDQTGRAAAVAGAGAAAADSHSRFVGAVDSHILIVALGNQYIVLVLVLVGGVVGSLWRGYPLGRIAGRTRRFDNWQVGTMPAPVSGMVVAGAVVAGAAAIVVAGRTAGCIRWDLHLRNRSTDAAVVVAAAAASQRSIGETTDQEEEIQHLCLGNGKRRWRCDL